MRRSHRAIDRVREGERLAFVALLALVVLLPLGCRNTTALPVAGDPPAFDGARALALVAEQVNFGPRPSGSPALKMTGDWIAETARAYGYTEVRIDEWREETAAGPKTFRNVIVEVPGHGSRRIVVGSHYDTKAISDAPNFVGANDGGSSTGVLLELLRAIRAHGEWRGLPLTVVFFDGEEAVRGYTDTDGLHGSKRLAGQLADAGDISKLRAMVLLDMIGDSDLTVTLPPNCDPDLKRLVLDIAQRQGHGGHFGHYTYGRILDDHEPFRERKVPTVNLIDFEYGPGNSYWHTDQDTLDKLSADSLQIIGDVTAELLWTLR